MRINNNITALNSHRQYNINAGNIGKNVEKLSSGSRVNRAADDAAGLAISEKMRAQIRGLNMASKNTQDAISLVQTAEGGMQTIQDILQRIRELAVQSASDTNHDKVDREALDLEVQQLLDEINDIADTTEFNNMKLLNGSYELNFKFNDGATPPVPNPDINIKDALRPPGRELVIQTGANQFQTMSISVKRMSSDGLFLQGTKAHIKASDDTYNGTPLSWAEFNDPTKGFYSIEWHVKQYTENGAYRISVGSRHAAEFAIGKIEAALNSVSTQRAMLGAFQNRLEFKVQNLNNQAENVAAAESRIRDADMAKMMTEFTKNNILFQSSTAMLAQANALPQGVLQLLG